MKKKTTWTKSQQQVIDLRGSSMLVSAAAGSGKTAVLTERILSRICDPVHPVDIDRILVVTFTNAAAQEMRQRIRDKLRARLEENPGSAHLRAQITLLGICKMTHKEAYFDIFVTQIAIPFIACFIFIACCGMGM